MIRTTVYAFCAVAIASLGAGPLLAGSLPSKAVGDLSPIIQLTQHCKPDGKSCKSNDQCCSGNCQKATDAPKGKCMHGD